MVIKMSKLYFIMLIGALVFGAYFYGTNILRNARLITNERSTLYRILDFLYYVMSLRVLERCVYLRDYFEYEKRDRSVS